MLAPKSLYELDARKTAVAAITKLPFPPPLSSEGKQVPEREASEHHIAIELGNAARVEMRLNGTARPVWLLKRRGELWPRRLVVRLTLGGRPRHPQGQLRAGVLRPHRAQLSVGNPA
jgi:hypothetical protein